MLDIFISGGLGLVSIALAYLGAHISMNPTETPKQKRIYKCVFIALGIVAVSLIVSQTIRNNNTQDALRDSIGALNNRIQLSDSSRQVENVYLKAKLEDAFKANVDFRDMFSKLAQAGAENIKKQSDQKALSNQKLLQFTRDVIKRMREYETTHDEKQRHISDDYRAKGMELRIKSGPFTAESTKLANDQAKEMTDEEIRYRSQFMLQILDDAVYARDELMRRVTTKPEISADDRDGMLVFHGVVIGIYPIAKAANYLERLAKNLSQ